MLKRGIITDFNDPEKRGRVRVQVWGIHTTRDSNLPWAEVIYPSIPGLSSGVGVNGLMRENTSVFVEFEDDDYNCPVVLGTFVSGGEDGQTSDLSPDVYDKTDDNNSLFRIQTPGGMIFEMDDSNKTITFDTGQGTKTVINGNDDIINMCTSGGSNIEVNGQDRLINMETDRGSNIKLDDNINLKGNNVDLDGSKFKVDLITGAGIDVGMGAKIYSATTSVSANQGYISLAGFISDQICSLPTSPLVYIPIG